MSVECKLLSGKDSSLIFVTKGPTEHLVQREFFCNGKEMLGSKG